MARTWSRTRRGKTKKNNPFTKSDALAARRALRDAYRSRKELSAALYSNDLPIIRLRWITAITILRSVGHVLRNIDASRSPDLKCAIDTAWNRWNANAFQHLIFHEFIEKERNNILKEYRASIFPSTSAKEETEDAPKIYSSLLVGDRSYSPLEAVDASIRWWEAELNHIEAQAGNPDS